jgi:uncharacterized protein YraI
MMRLRNSLLLSILWVLLFPSAAVASIATEESSSEPDAGWEVITEGIEYQKFTLPDPNNVFVVRMLRSNPALTLESAIASGKLASGRESVSEMFSRYDQAINFWGGGASPIDWGMRNQVVVAINGSYFDWNTGEPQGGQVQAGWYAKRYDNFGGWSGFVWKLDRSALIGECVTHLPDRQTVTFMSSGNIQKIEGINKSRGQNAFILYTPQYSDSTGTDNSGVEVVVELSRPTMILPSPAYVSGIIRQVRNQQGDSPLAFNTIVLSASETDAQDLLANAQVGGEIRISQEITSFRSDCSTPYAFSWTKTYASIQGAFFYLREGEIRDFDDPGATNRNPRTAIAYNDQFVFFIVVDGRDIENSLGMTIHQLAVFTRDTLGATWGVAQDGGGSSTMVINGEIKNNTFCNIYSCMGEYRTFLPMVNRNLQKEQVVTRVSSAVIHSPTGIERAVANGMLMVVAQPSQYSSSFAPGTRVTVTGTTELRLGPGTNYDHLATVPGGSQGEIVGQMNGLNGVLAKGVYWWYVDFGGILGWVPEGAIAGSSGLNNTQPGSFIPSE